MARKLTKEELERYKADFDPPINPEPEKKTTTKNAKAKTKTGAKKKTDEQKKREKEAAIPISKPEPEPKKENRQPDTSSVTVDNQKHAGGRPRKSDEETRVFSFRLPGRTVKRLRVLAALDGVSAADIIIRLADRENVPGLDA